MKGTRADLTVGRGLTGKLISLLSTCGEGRAYSDLELCEVGRPEGAAQGAPRASRQERPTPVPVYPCVPLLTHLRVIHLHHARV